jgi:hypothetical protein
MLFYGPLPFEVGGGVDSNYWDDSESEIVCSKEVANAGVSKEGATTLETEVAVVVTHGWHDWLEKKKAKNRLAGFFWPMGI